MPDTPGEPVRSFVRMQDAPREPVRSFVRMQDAPREPVRSFVRMPDAPREPVRSLVGEPDAPSEPVRFVDGGLAAGAKACWPLAKMATRNEHMGALLVHSMMALRMLGTTFAEFLG